MSLSRDGERIAVRRLDRFTEEGLLYHGRLAYRLKTPWRDGTTHVVMERRELLERLAPLIPPPRAHQARYHGVLAPCASGRDQVVPRGTGAKQIPCARSPASALDVGSMRAADGRGDAEMIAVAASPEVRAEGSVSRVRRVAWAELLKRVFEIDALRCPARGETMRIIAAITDPSMARRILECLALPPRAPRSVRRTRLIQSVAWTRVCSSSRLGQRWNQIRASTSIRRWSKTRTRVEALDRSESNPTRRPEAIGVGEARSRPGYPDGADGPPGNGRSGKA